jgi:hypothetical protein
MYMRSGSTVRARTAVSAHHNHSGSSGNFVALFGGFGTGDGLDWWDGNTCHPLRQTAGNRQLLPAAGRWRRFAAALERTFALDRRLARLATDDTVVCRCEDVAAGRLRCHRSWREAKLMTRIGMGPCQGWVCGPAADTLFGWSPDDVRPPLKEVPLADLS